MLVTSFTSVSAFKTFQIIFLSFNRDRFLQRLLVYESIDISGLPERNASLLGAVAVVGGGGGVGVRRATLKMSE